MAVTGDKQHQAGGAGSGTGASGTTTKTSSSTTPTVANTDKRRPQAAREL